MTKKLPAYLPAAVAIMAVAVIVHFLSGLRFPVPWVDESYFLLQSLSFARDNSLLAPELVPDRPLMWMQPGYMVILGGFFKLGAFSLQHAREVSLAFYCVAIALFCKVAWGSQPSWRIVFIALVFLVPSSLVVSNVARMEAMILALGLGVLAATLANRFVLAVALVLLGALIHPNGVYFGLPMVFAMTLRRREFMEQVRRTVALDWAVLILAVVSVALYGAYIVQNLDGFRIDMAFQFTRKLERVPFYHNVKALVLLILALAVTVGFLWRKSQSQAIVAAFAAAMILIAVNGQEMWYQVFRNVGVGTLMLVLAAEVRHVLLRWGMVVAMALAYVAVAGFDFSGMSPHLSGDYLGEKASEDLKAGLLETQRSLGGKMSVSFNFTSADLLLLDFMREHGIELVRRMPKEITPERAVDLCVYVARPEDPSWLRASWAIDYPDPSLCRHGIAMSSSRDKVSILSFEAYESFYQSLSRANAAHPGSRL
ncbi:MAG: hypothetical protein M3N82_00680 [Pseudomonadota bacterium]|nr:hypothetical protein [Pseudomonadota bacterium]